MIFRILILLLLLLLLPVFIIDRLLLKKKLRLLWKIILWIPNIVLCIWVLRLGIFETYTIESDHDKGLLLSIILCLGIPELIYACFLLLGRFFKGSIFRKGFAGIGILAGAISLMVLLYGFTFGLKRIIIKHFTYTAKVIPQAFRNYKIVQLSDLHLGSFMSHPGIVKNIVYMTNAQKPDLIVFTGDIVNYDPDELSAFTNILKKMRAKDGVVAIMGNHDYLTYRNWQGKKMKEVNRLKKMIVSLNWRLLLNSHFFIHKGCDSIAIVGIENDGLPPFPAYGDIGKARKGLKPGCFEILLSHDPTVWRRKVIKKTTIPLTLSGHTHGMQFKIGSFSPAEWFYKEWGGPYYSGKQCLYVSMGVGEGLLPFRFGAWPEINVITLK